MGQDRNDPRTAAQNIVHLGEKIGESVSEDPFPPPLETGYILSIDTDPIPDPEIAPKRRGDRRHDVRMLPDVPDDIGDEVVRPCHQRAHGRVLGYVLVIVCLAQAKRAEQMRFENGDTDGVTSGAKQSATDEHILVRNTRGARGPAARSRRANLGLM